MSSITDCKGEPLSVFDIVRILQLPKETIDREFYEHDRQQLVGCEGAYGMIVHQSDMELSPPWHVNGNINVLAARFDKEEWSPYETFVPLGSVVKLSDNLVVSYLFVNMKWMIAEHGGGIRFPAREAKRQIELFRKIVATPQDKLEKLSDYVKSQLTAN